MCFEEFLVVLNCCLFSVERLKESLVLKNGMGVPLFQNRAEGWMQKEILVEYVAGQSTKETLGGRSILEKRRQNWEFDSTKGFPGEDTTSAVGDC